MSAQELESYLSPTLDGVEAEGAVSAALQASIRQQEAGGPAEPLPSGLFEVHPNVIELGSRAVLRGDGAMRTVLRVPSNSEGRVVSTQDFEAWETAGTGLWSHTRVPTGVEVRSVGVHGGGSDTDNPDEYSGELTYRLDGFSIHSPGAVLDRVQAFRCEGYGIRYNRGNALRYGPWQWSDKEVAEISHAHVVKCLTGIHIAGSADGILRDSTIFICRDACLQVEGAAWNISNIHAAGCITDDENEDHGIGILNGAPDGLSGPNYFGSQIQADNCRIGFRNYAPGTTMTQFIGKLCRDVSLDVRKSLTCGDFTIDNMTTEDVVGIYIHQAAQFTRLNGGTMGMSSDTGTGIVCLANGCVINMENYWGGSLDNTALVYGKAAITGPPAVPAIEPSGGEVDIYVNGCDTALKIDAIGYGNKITVRHGNLVTNPVVLASGLTASTIGAKGNVVKAINIQTGATTFTTL
jgi:hypothetical protein